MSIKVIKYFFFLLFFGNCLLLAQVTESELGQPAVNAAVPQNTSSDKKSLKEIYSPEITEIKILKEEISRSINKQNYEPESNNKKEEPLFNILSSSFRNNIRFGGFWENYAIINFTPSVFIKPLSFVSVYANNSHSCFIPMEGIKEHVKSLFIQSAAILAIDNSIKLLFGAGKIIPSITGFAVKTIIINSVMSSINKNKKNKIRDYKSYYLAVSIRF